MTYIRALAEPSMPYNNQCIASPWQIQSQIKPLTKTTILPRGIAKHVPTLLGESNC